MPINPANMFGVVTRDETRDTEGPSFVAPGAEPCIFVQTQRSYPWEK